MTLNIFELILRNSEKDSSGKCVLKKVSPYCPAISEKQQEAMETHKKLSVPLEEALNLAGVGLYTGLVLLVSGFTVFVATIGIQVMSIIIPVAGCDLALSSIEKGALTSMSFLGMMFSSFLFGFLADTYGRRKVMIWSSILNATMSVLSSLAPNDISLMVIWFFNGFLLGGVLTPAFVYASEFCPQRIRARSILIPYSLSSLASVYLPCIAWLILPLKVHIPLGWGLIFTPWRLYLLLVTTPAILFGAFLLYILPESPKFILNKGKEEETLEILKQMYSWNHYKNKELFPVQSVSLDANDEIQKKKQKPQNTLWRFLTNLVNQAAILCRPPLLLYTTVSCIILFGAIGSYNTIYLWYPEQLRMLVHYSEAHLKYNATLCDVTSQYTNSNVRGKKQCEINEDIFIISVFTALVQSIVCVVVSFTADKLGKKTLIVILCGLSGGLCIALIYLHDYFLTIGSLSVAVILLSTTFPIGLSIVVDFFPTSLRSTAISITMIFGRLGAAGGSQIFGALSQSYCEFAYWGILFVLLCTVLLAIIMPSTRKPDSEAAVNLKGTQLTDLNT